MRLRDLFSSFFAKAACLLLAAGLLSQAIAQESAGDDKDAENKYRWVIQEALRETKNIGQPCFDCGITMAGKSDTGKPEMSSSCQAAYAGLYDKPVVDMRVVFGYLDKKNSVDDRYQAAALIEQVTNPCDGSTNTCGFQQADDDGELFEKQVLGKDGRWRTVRLTIVSSSASDSERKNRNELKYKQESKTRRAEEVFYGGLKSADVLVYAGHARDGGGPDFGPPRLQEKVKATNLQWYRDNHPSWDRLQREIAGSSTHPKIFGLYGCNAERHFGEKLRKAMPNTGVALAGPKAWFSTALGQAFTTIDSALNIRCENDFLKALHTAKDIDDELASPARFEGFFRGANATAGASGGAIPQRSQPGSAGAPSGYSSGASSGSGSIGTGSIGTPYPNSIRGGTRPGSYPLPPLPMVPADPQAPVFNPYTIY